MARPRLIDKELVSKAEQIANTTRDVGVLRQCQAVLLPAFFGATLEQTARSLGVSRATVPRLQAAFRFFVQRSSESACSQKPNNWGGRRRSLMSLQEEVEFLQPWLEAAKRGGMVVVSPIRSALAQRLGRPVKASIVYRLLARHGWRKVAPDTRHPKSDPVVQEEWKKNSRMRWEPCLMSKA